MQPSNESEINFPVRGFSGLKSNLSSRLKNNHVLTENVIANHIFMEFVDSFSSYSSSLQKNFLSRTPNDLESLDPKFQEELGEKIKKKIQKLNLKLQNTNIKLENPQKYHDLGQGSEGKVELVYSKYDRSFFAVKSLSLNEESSLESLYKHLKVIWRLVKINLTENCHKVIDLYKIFYEEKKTLELTMELGIGDLLSFLNYMEINKLKLPAFLAQKFKSELQEQKDVLFKYRIYHRDIKLENVIVTDDLRVKFSDFGFSVALGREDDSKNYYCAVCGTREYMDPDLLNLFTLGISNYKIDLEKSDTFALEKIFDVIDKFTDPYHDEESKRPEIMKKLTEGFRKHQICQSLKMYYKDFDSLNDLTKKYLENYLYEDLLPIISASSDEFNDVISNVHILIILAKILQSLRVLTHSREKYHKALESIQKIETVGSERKEEILIEIFQGLAEVNELLDYEDAEKYVKVFDDLPDSSKIKKPESLANFFIASAANKMRNKLYLDALKLQKKALEIQETHGLSTLKTYDRMAANYMFMDNYKKFFETADICLKMTKDDEFSTIRANVFENLYLTNLKIFDFENAKRALEENYKILSKIHLKDSTSLKERFNYSQALLDFFRFDMTNSSKIFETLVPGVNSYQYLIRFHLEGMIASNMRRYKEALILFLESIKLRFRNNKNLEMVMPIFYTRISYLFRIMGYNFLSMKYLALWRDLSLREPHKNENIAYYNEIKALCLSTLKSFNKNEDYKDFASRGDEVYLSIKNDNFYDFIATRDQNRNSRKLKQ